jgi:hypothetical protein
VLIRDQLVHWLGPTIWRVEIDDRYSHVTEPDKTVVRRARLVEQFPTWNERTARSFAADCAERVLPVYESAHPEDFRPREAIAVSRRFVGGKVTAEELSAARSAAGYAAGYAAGSAARSAARSAAEYAARSAAGAAARSAAGSAARSAAEYAARSAAEYAARYAARSAAGSAARSAAGAAARSAEREWQTERLWLYLDGSLT